MKRKVCSAAGAAPLTPRRTGGDDSSLTCCVVVIQCDYPLQRVYNSSVSVFFPKDEDLRRKWIRAIHRKDFVPTAHSKVCQLHFTEDQIRRTAEAYDERTGRKIVAPLKRLYLKDGAIPCVFKNIPKYLSNPIHSRESRDQRLERLENEQLELALSESIGTGVGVTNNRTGIGTWCTKLHKLNFNAILQKGGGVAFAAWDVGGAGRQRALWDHHYRRADAFVFVVDCADHLRLVVAREELELLLAHPDVRGRRAPLLVFANKSDAPGALSAPQTAAALGLQRLTDRPWHVCASSALSGHGLHEGVAWLARELREQHRHSGNQR
ncbi:ADP-ribosylation factor-like protein 6 [Eumeta japonica]|uniref:ADP-ribosylation factor-like protein 6 n=1 Tax=Eumeta variegata TaxID=151549 RepID=A0A4C1TQU1_EUMVA|nr:ADP-ribosylation factor-like protein 6 [Eumeta japonica]